MKKSSSHKLRITPVFHTTCEILYRTMMTIVIIAVMSGILMVTLTIAKTNLVAAMCVGMSMLISVCVILDECIRPYESVAAAQFKGIAADTQS